MIYIRWKEGGTGSGNFGHAGRPGIRGGSSGNTLKINLSDLTLKQGENYFLRFTNHPKKDIDRGYSVHDTGLSTIEEAVDTYGGDESDYVEFDGRVGQKIDGLAAYTIEATNIKDAYTEASEKIKADQQFKGSGISAYIFVGKETGGDVPEGTAFDPRSFIKVTDLKNALKTKVAIR
jgi:hypothetical protein